jgi:aminoglycoside 6'-N-acetyltransferase
LERAGFLREGIVRGAQYRGGSWHDLVLYARVRADGDAVPPLAGGIAGDE